MKYIIIGIIFLIFILILFFPIPFKISIQFVDNDFKIYIYNFQINKKKSKKNKYNSSKDPLSTIKKIKTFKFKLFKNKKIKTKLFLNLDYGLGDAFQTAISYGVLCGILNTFLAYLLNYIKFKSTKIKITPNYNKVKFNFLFKSIIYLNIVKIIYIVIKISQNKNHEKERSSLNESSN